MHTHNGLACKVQGLHNVANTIAHSHCLSLIFNYTWRNAHTGDETFKKGVVVDSLALKYCIDVFWTTANRKIFFRQMTLKKQLEKPNGQTTWNVANFLKFGCKTANLATLLTRCFHKLFSMILPVIVTALRSRTLKINRASESTNKQAFLLFMQPTYRRKKCTECLWVVV